MGKRKKMGSKESRRDFSKKASRVQKKNVQAPAFVMRGGVRL